MTHLSFKSIFTLCSALIMASATLATPLTVWISGSGSGIYRATFETETGKLSEPTLAAEFGAGSWIAPHPAKPILYSCYTDATRAGIASFDVDDSGNLERREILDLPPGSPAHIAVNEQGTLLATSHYGTGASTLVALEPDGTFAGPALVTEHTLDQPGPHERQGQPRPHFAAFTRDGTRVHQVDLGTNEIWTFDVSAQPLAQTFSHKIAMPPGYGPRHLAFHPSMKFAYTSQELGAKISAFSYDEAPAVFTAIQHLDSKGPNDIEPYNNTSHILVHPSGRFVYIGNRGHDSIGAFAIDEASGELKLIETEPARGHWPRNFAIDPSGRWLLVASQNSDTIGVMEINEDDGTLTFVRDSVVTVPNPVCIMFR